MPLVNWDTKDIWDLAYEFDAEPEGTSGRPGVRLHYNRHVAYRFAQQNIINCARVLGWTAATRALIVGCGFGWSIEVLLDELGLTQCNGVDLSVYIQSNKGLNEDAEIAAAIIAVGLNPNLGEGLTLFNRFRGDGGPRSKRANQILNQNINSQQGRNNIRGVMGGPHNYEILSEDVLTSLTDAECLQASNAAHQITSGRVSHLVTVWPLPDNPFIPFNIKRTLEAWKALIPADTFIEAGSWRVL